MKSCQSSLNPGKMAMVSKAQLFLCHIAAVLVLNCHCFYSFKAILYILCAYSEQDHMLALLFLHYILSHINVYAIHVISNTQDIFILYRLFLIHRTFLYSTGYF